MYVPLCLETVIHDHSVPCPSYLQSRCQNTPTNQTPNPKRKKKKKNRHSPLPTSFSDAEEPVLPFLGLPLLEPDLHRIPTLRAANAVLTVSRRRLPSTDAENLLHGRDNLPNVQRAAEHGQLPEAAMLAVRNRKALALPRAPALGC